MPEPPDTPIPDPACRVRPASSADIPAMCALLAELFSREADFLPDAEKQRLGLERILADPAVGRILVCELGGEVVGMVGLLFSVSTAEGGRSAWLEDMVVAPGCRDAGIGGALLARALEAARDEGISRVTLLTDRDNVRAQAFYARRGFTLSAMVPMRISL